MSTLAATEEVADAPALSACAADWFVGAVVDVDGGTSPDDGDGERRLRIASPGGPSDADADRWLRFVSSGPRATDAPPTFSANPLRDSDGAAAAAAAATVAAAAGGGSDRCLKGAAVPVHVDIDALVSLNRQLKPPSLMETLPGALAAVFDTSILGVESGGGCDGGARTLDSDTAASAAEDGPTCSSLVCHTVGDLRVIRLFSWATMTAKSGTPLSECYEIPAPDDATAMGTGATKNNPTATSINDSVNHLPSVDTPQCSVGKQQGTLLGWCFVNRGLGVALPPAEHLPAPDRAGALGLLMVVDLLRSELDPRDGPVTDDGRLWLECYDARTHNRVDYSVGVTRNS
jgi:hypothetical protein